ncbi:MAG: hypothetical protein HUN04_06375 [Desulfobacter sp.]|nr:MAG: hypothetical protein HUN04_06375 [Desulfobacter sp.]
MAEKVKLTMIFVLGLLVTGPYSPVAVRAMDVGVQDFYVNVDVQDFYIEVNVQDFYLKTGVEAPAKVLESMGTGGQIQTRVGDEKTARKVFRADVHKGDPVMILKEKIDCFLLVHKKAGTGVRARIGSGRDN